MKKIFLLLPLCIISCENIDRLGQLNEYPAELKSQISQNNKVVNPNAPNAGITVMNLEIEDRINPSNGGCTFEAFNNSEQYFYDSTSSFGPNPQYFDGYMIRGYGNPRTSINYTGLRLHAENKGMNVVANGQQIWTNSPVSNAISIEYNFKANVTYEVSVTSWIYDTIFRSKNNQINIDDDFYDIPQSETNPSVGIQLKSTPEISGVDACANRPMVATEFLVNSNYYKSAEVALSNRAGQITNYTLNFSTLENKSSLQIYLLPKILLGRPPSQVLKSNFYMFIRNIKVVEKPYDPQYHVESPIRGNPCGMRGGC